MSRRTPQQFPSLKPAVVFARAMSKFAAAYTDAPPEWYDFLSWGVAKGHWPTLPSMT